MIRLPTQNRSEFRVQGGHVGDVADDAKCVVNFNHLDTTSMFTVNKKNKKSNILVNFVYLI